MASGRWCDTKSLVSTGLVDWRVGGDGVAPSQCSRPVSALTCVAGNGGVRRSGFKFEGARSTRGPQVAEGSGRVNASEPLMMPRQGEPRVMGSSAEVEELAVVKRQAATGGIYPIVRTPPFPGLRGHPARSCLVQVERDNPVEVRAAIAVR